MFLCLVVVFFVVVDDDVVVLGTLRIYVWFA